MSLYKLGFATYDSLVHITHTDTYTHTHTFSLTRAYILPFPVLVLLRPALFFFTGLVVYVRVCVCG
jgi:hypothetical protein